MALSRLLFQLTALTSIGDSFPSRFLVRINSSSHSTVTSPLGFSGYRGIELLPTLVILARYRHFILPRNQCKVSISTPHLLDHRCESHTEDIAQPLDVHHDARVVGDDTSPLSVPRICRLLPFVSVSCEQLPVIHPDATYPSCSMPWSATGSCYSRILWQGFKPSTKLAPEPKLSA